MEEVPKPKRPLQRGRRGKGERELKKTTSNTRESMETGILCLGTRRARGEESDKKS